MPRSHPPRIAGALLAAALGFAVCPPSSSAQNAAPPTPTGTDSRTDAAIAARVRAALHSDPYFYDEHVDVTLENGLVVLRGFVFSDWDLHNAISIATKAADGRKVVDDLSIKEGGRR